MNCRSYLNNEIKHNRPLWVAVQGLIRPTPYTYINNEIDCFLLFPSHSRKLHYLMIPTKCIVQCLGYLTISDH
jgi:hypothetical protein